MIFYFMPDKDNNNAFASFMAPKSNREDKIASSSIITPNKTKESLSEAKEKKEEGKNKEIEDAKKNSLAMANRYKSTMVEAQLFNIIKVLPFIIIAAIFFILLIFKGGDWASKGLNFLFNTMVGN